MKKLLSDCEPNWTTLRKAIEDEERSLQEDWGTREVPHVEIPDRKNKVTKHEEEKTINKLTDKGWASVSETVVKNALQSITKLKTFDESIKK